MEKFIVSNTASSGNDEFYTPYYAITPLINYIKEKGYINILCPFDTEESRIVLALKAKGFNVTHSHINKGEDFFNLKSEDLEDVDVIISNPPYSLKGEVFSELFKLGKPFAMLVGIVGLFESKKRFNMFKNNPFEVMYLDKRVSYHSSFTSEEITKSPPFSSCWVCSNVLPSRVEFEEIDKKCLSLEKFLLSI